MCEILVKAIEVPHFDPSNINPGWYRPGDPVVVMEDGHPWGLEEGPPKFWVFQIPEMSKEEARVFIGESRDPSYTLLKRRTYTLSLSRLPQVARDKLLGNGKATISRAEALVAIQRKDVV